MYSFYKLMPLLLKPALQLILDLAADFYDIYFFQKTKQCALSVTVLWLISLNVIVLIPVTSKYWISMPKMYHIASFMCSEIILLFATDIVLITIKIHSIIMWCRMNYSFSNCQTSCFFNLWFILFIDCLCTTRCWHYFKSWPPQYDQYVFRLAMAVYQVPGSMTGSLF